MRGFSLALALAVVASPLSAHADKPRQTIVVAPFDGAVGDLGYAAMLKTIGALEAHGDAIVVHPKQYARVVEHHGHKLGGLSVRDRYKQLATSLGADWIVSGIISATETKVGIAVDLTGVRSEVVASTTVESKDLIAALDALPASVLTLLGKSKAIDGAREVAPMQLTMKSKSRDALIYYAACYRLLIRQPIGIRQPVLLDGSALEEAIELCENSKRADTAFADTRAALGLAYALWGNRKSAELHLASVKNEKAFLPMYAIGKFWILSRYYSTDLALQSLEKSIADHPTFLLGRGYLGDAYSALGRYLESQRVYEAYLEIIPNQPFVMGRIGYALARQGKHEDAIRWTKKGLRLAPSDSELMLELAGRLIDAKRPDDAIAVLKRIIAEGGARGEVHLRLGYAYLLTDQLPAAEREFYESVRKSTNLSEWRTRGRARYDLAKVWMRQGNTDNALRQLRYAVKEGFKDSRVFELDSDLKSLTKDPKFKELMAAKRDANRPDFVSPFEFDASTATLVTNPGKKGDTSPKTISF